MAAKGQASKSATGASMSKYDVEVESRLQKLEAAVAKLQADSHPDRGGDSVTKCVQEQLDALTAFMESARRRL